MNVGIVQLLFLTKLRHVVLICEKVWYVVVCLNHQLVPDNQHYMERYKEAHLQRVHFLDKYPPPLLVAFSSHLSSCFTFHLCTKLDVR